MRMAVAGLILAWTPRELVFVLSVSDHKGPIMVDFDGLRIRTTLRNDKGGRCTVSVRVGSWFRKPRKIYFFMYTSVVMCGCGCLVLCTLFV